MRSLLVVPTLLSSLLISVPTWCAPSAPLSMPSAHSVQGLQLEVTSTGFGSPDKVLKESSKTNPQSSFYFSYSASLLGAALTKEQSSEMIAFNELFTSQGAPIRTLASSGQTYFFEDVEPDWKSVRAEFEVRNPRSLPQDVGRDQTHREFKDVVLPAIGEAIQPQNIEFETSRGTRVRLVKLSRAHWTLGDPNRFRDRSTLKAEFEIKRPEDTPGAEVKMENVRVLYEKHSDSGRDERTEGGIQIESLNVPENAKTVSYSFDLIESARRWRKVEAFKRLSFDIPVAAVWKKVPLQPQIPYVPSVVNRNADFEARWDGGYDLWGGIAQEYTVLNSRLWMRDLNPDPKLGIWTPKKVEVVEGDKLTNVFSWAKASQGVFHADNLLRERDETGYELQYHSANRPELFPEVKVTAQRAQTYVTTHVLKDVPLPVRNQMREYKANEFFDGTWHLRRAIWMDDPEANEMMGVPGGAKLLLTFGRDPKTYFFEDGMQLLENVLYDEKGKIPSRSSTFQDGDPMLKGHEKDRVTLILSAPAPGTTHFGANFLVRQQVWSGEEEELVLPRVGLGVRPGAQVAKP